MSDNIRMIQYSKQATKFLERQTLVIRQRITNAISRLPYHGDIKKMEGGDTWRLRVGDYRVIFDDDGNVIYVYRSRPRGDAYKGGKIR